MKKPKKLQRDHSARMGRNLPTRLDITQLEQRLGINRQTIRRWYINPLKGFPKPHFMGQKRVWWLVEVERWESENTTSDTQVLGHD